MEFVERSCYVFTSFFAFCSLFFIFLRLLPMKPPFTSPFFSLFSKLEQPTLHVVAVVSVVVGFGIQKSSAIGLRTNDGGGTSSFTSPLTGSAAGWGATGVAATSGNTYEVTTGLTLRGPQNNSSYTFAGDSLEVQSGGTFLLKNNGTDGAGVLTVNDLILSGGKVRQAFSSTGGNNIGTIAGNITLATGTTSALGAGVKSSGGGYETLRITATITGSGSLDIGATTSSDTGHVELTAANTYTGDTNITRGTLLLSHADALQNSTLTYSAGTLSFNSGIGTFNLGGLSGSSNIALADTASSPITLDVGGNNANTTYSGALSGDGNLVKSGTGSLTLTGASTYTGTTAIQNGTVILDGGNNRLPTTTTVTLGEGTTSGVLQLGDSSARNQELAGLVTSGSGTDNRVVGGNASISTLTLNVSSTDTYNGYLGGSGTDQNNLALVMNGAGTLTLTSANTYTGGTTIAGAAVNTDVGAISITNDSALGTGDVTVGIGSGDALLQLSNDITVANTINIAGDDSAARIENLSGGNTITGDVNFYTTGGTTATILSSAGSLTIDGDMTATGPTGTRNFAFDGAGGTTVNGVISDGTATVGVAQNGAGTTTLTGTNTYTGPTVVNDGKLIISGSIQTVTNNIGVYGDGILQFGDGTSTSGSAPSSGTIFVNNTGTVQLDYTNGGTLSNQVASNPSAVTTLSGANAAGTTNTFTGTMYSNGGSFNTNSTNAGATLEFSNAFAMDIKGTTLNVNGAGDTLFSGSIYNSSGSGSVVKNDSGTLTLTASNSYSGSTTVNGGTLLVDGGAITSSATTVQSGATIATGSTGTVGTSLTVNSGGTFAPGTEGAVGTATVLGNTTMNSGSIFSWDMNEGGTYDQVTLSSGSLGGSGATFDINNLTNSGDYTGTFWDSNQSWSNIFSGSPTLSSIFSTFSGLNISSTGVVAGQGQFSFSGSDLVWTAFSAVPEISTAFAGLLLASGMLKRRRGQ